MRKLKRMISLLLCVMLLAQLSPAVLAEGYASAPYETVDTEHGKTLRDQVIDGNLVLDETTSLYIDGTITLKNGEVIVTGGQHEISRDAVIRGNIIIAGPAEVRIDGIVEGELRLNWDCWEEQDARWQQEEIANHLFVEVGEHALLRGIRSGGFQGEVLVSGSVTSVEVEDTRDATHFLSTGRIEFLGKAFANDINAKGSAAPVIVVREEALVSRVNISGGANLEMEGGRVNELNVTNGADSYLYQAKIGQINASGAGVWIAAKDGQIGQVNLSNPNYRSINSDEWYHEDHTVMTVEKGTTVDSVIASGLSSFTASNVSIDEADTFEGQPIASLDREALFKETRIGTVVTSGPVSLENDAYMESVTLGRGANMWGSGMTQRLEATDASVAMARSCELSSEIFYHNRVRGTFNEEYYHGVSIGFANIKGGSIDLAAGAGAQTLIVEDAYVSLSEFHQIDNLVLNNVRSLRPAEDGAMDENGVVTSFEKQERIGRLFFNSNTWNFEPWGDPLMHIGMLSIFQDAMCAFADVDKLLLPSRQNELSTGVRGNAVQGVRPEPVAIEEHLPENEGQEETKQETQTTYYVREIATTKFKQGDRSDGNTARSKAKELRLQRHQIAKNGTRDLWYTVETSALQTLNIQLDADEGMGMLVVYGPDEQRETLVSEGDSAELSLISAQGGAWTLRLIGAPNDYAMDLSVSEPISVEINATLQPSNSKGNGKKTALDLTACDFTVENVTQGTEPVFFVTNEGVVMATDQASRGDVLRITLRDPQDTFIPVSVDVRLDKTMRAQAKLETAEYGSYTVSCRDNSGVYMHLYDADGAYVMTLQNNNGTYRADKLTPGSYQLVMIRGDVGRWRFSRLSDYAEFGLQAGRDYRLDTFKLQKGYTDSYPGATVPQEPVLDSAYAAEDSSRFDAAKSVCLENGSVLMRAEYALENVERITECAVEIELSGMRVDPQAVTLDGSPVACTLENDVLRIPVTGHSEGKIAFYAHSTEQKEMFAIARLRVQATDGSELAYLGFAALEKQKLSIHASPQSSGAVNLFGYGVPGERLALLRDGNLAAYVDCDMNGEWNRTLHVDATVGYETYQFAVAAFAGTANELISEPVAVRVQNDTPSLTGVELYYYEHEIQRKLTLSAEQFYRGGLTYNYLPGSAFTFNFLFDNSERIEKLNLVLGTKMGDEIVIPCAYSAKTGAFTASGEFPRSSMSDTIRLDWRLSPLPEPAELQPLDEAAVEKALSLEVQTANARLVDNEYVECDLSVRLGGQESVETSVRIEMGIRDFDMDRLAEEAIARYDMEDGGIAFLMGDAQQPASTYLVLVDVEDAEIYKLSSKEEESFLMKLALHSGLLSEASAASGGFAALAQEYIAIGAMVAFDVVAGLASSVIEVYTYDIMMIGTYSLRNKVEDAWEKVLQEIEEETSPERLRCLSDLAARYSQLYDRCTNVASEYSKKATIEGIMSLVPNLLSKKTLDAIRKFGKRSDEMSRLRKAQQDTVDLWKAYANEAKEGMDEQIKFLTGKGDYNPLKTMRKWWEKHKEDCEKIIKEISEIPKEEKISQKTLDKIVDLFADLGGLGFEIKDITGYTKDKIEMIPDILQRIEKAIELEDQMKESEENLRQAEEELKQTEEQIESESKGFTEEMVGFARETVDEIARMIYDDFKKDYEDLKREYYYLQQVDCPKKTPTPTPSPTPTPTPTYTPTSTPTSAPTPTEPVPTAPQTVRPTPKKDSEDSEDDSTKPGVVVPNNGNPDPSGYVYEAMWSNRIADVTVTAYTRDATGAVVQWDAEPYGQKNPMQSDEQGYYEWYVPEGDWLVTYEKEGYEPAQSEWMVVPPPQTEVHQNLISREAPQALYAAHYGDAVEIAFSKPIQVESVNEKTVSIGAKFTVQAVNPERYGDTDTILATLFQLVPENNLPNMVEVRISGGVISYAGVGCEEATLACSRMARLNALTTQATINAQVGSPYTLTVQAQGGDFERYTIAVSGAHADMLRIDRIGAFDANGYAAIELTPLVPGVVLLDIRVPDTRVATTVKIVMAD